MSRVRTVKLTIVEDDDSYIDVILERGSKKITLGNARHLWVHRLAAAVDRVEDVAGAEVAEAIQNALVGNALAGIVDYYATKGYLNEESAERVKDNLNPSRRGEQKEKR